MVDQSVIEIAQRYLSRLQASGLPVVRAILFGSRARGVATEESDIDILLHSPTFERPTWRQEALAWEIARSVDWRIEPVLCGESAYERNDWHPLIVIAKQDGLEIRADNEVPGTGRSV